VVLIQLHLSICTKNVEKARPHTGSSIPLILSSTPAAPSDPTFTKKMGFIGRARTEKTTGNKVENPGQL
jgi:hypothetical protein